MPYAHEMRVLIEATGALMVTHPGGVRERRAAPGEVTRVLFLDAAATANRLGRPDSAAGALVLLAGVRPLLALRLQDWQPPTALDPVVMRVTSGVEALAAGLGLPVEPAETEDLGILGPRALREVEVRPLPARPAPGKAVRVLAPLAAVLAFVGGPAGGTVAAPVCTALALALCAPVVLGVARGRAQARAATATATPSGQGIVIPVRPTGGVPAGLLDNVLELGPDELFLRRRGEAGWLAGPGQGGIVQAVMEPAHVRLSDADGLDHAVLETALWCGDEPARAELADDLRAGGLRVLDAPLDTVLRHDTGDLATAHVKPSQLLTDLERGDPTVLAPYAGGMAAAITMAFSLGTLGWNVLLGLVLFTLALALFAIAMTSTWRRARGDRAAVRVVKAAGRPKVQAR